MLHEDRAKLLELLDRLYNKNKHLPEVRIIKLYNPGSRCVYIAQKDDPQASGPWELDDWVLIAVRKPKNKE